MSPCCGTCRFWKGYGSNGDCRRRAPVVVAKDPRQGSDTGMSMTTFPRTNDYWWCGEFERPIEEPQGDDPTTEQTPLA
jgi:hypothetical protein